MGALTWPTYWVTRNTEHEEHVVRAQKILAAIVVIIDIWPGSPICSELQLVGKTHCTFLRFAHVVSFILSASPSFICMKNSELYLNATCSMRISWIFPSSKSPTVLCKFLRLLTFSCVILYNSFYPWKDVWFICDFLVTSPTEFSLMVGWTVKSHNPLLSVDILLVRLFFQFFLNVIHQTSYNLAWTGENGLWARLGMEVEEARQKEED